MIERITEDLSCIKVPLPGNPLKELNAYLLRGTERNILIDTGFRREECREALETGLNELGVKMEETDIVLTHLHSDHAGLAPDVIAPGRDIYLGAIDCKHMVDNRNLNKWVHTNNLLSKENFPMEILEQSAKINPARSMAPRAYDNYLPLEDNDVLDLGNHKLRTIFTPGHTPSQVCFWLEEEDILFSADHVLFDSTPNLPNWPSVEDSLSDYIESLKATRELPARMTLPSHRHGTG